ncbi:uncharacterized protein LOC120339921 [Styela clava]
MKTAIILTLVALLVVENTEGWGFGRKILKFGAKAGKAVAKAATSPTGRAIIKSGVNAAIGLVGDVQAIREMDETEINQLFDAIQMIREMDDDEFLYFAKAASMEDFE